MLRKAVLLPGRVRLAAARGLATIPALNARGLALAAAALACAAAFALRHRREAS